MRILVIAPALPQAHGKGYQLRLHHQLLGLASRHEVTLVALDGRGQRMAGAALTEICRTVRLVRRPPWSRLAGTLVSSARVPATVAYFQSREMFRTVATTCSDQRFDVAHVQLIPMAPYRAALGKVPKVLDLVDALSASMAERARRAPPGVRSLFRVEANRLRRFELGEIRSYDRSLIVSDSDLATLGRPEKVVIHPLGADLNGNGPPARQPVRKGIVFSGTMNYFANEDAAIWFARQVLPIVRRVDESVTFTVVGRDPTAGVRALARLPNVTVTGMVDSVEPYLRQAAVAVCPVRLGTGMQTKILEAMAAGTPVVATPKSREGLPVDLKDLVSVGASSEKFAHEVIRLLHSPDEAQRQAERAFAQVKRAHTWSDAVAELEACYEEAIGVAAARP